MRILILGAGRMGSFFIDLLSFSHEVAIYETDARKMRFVYNCQRFTDVEEIRSFGPEMVLNCVTLKDTTAAFDRILPYVSQDCLLSDIASVKTGMKEYYDKTQHPFVSTHPMFGPTFANLNQLSNENAIIISEGSDHGKQFFRDLYSTLHLNIYEYSFTEHDRTVAYSLSIPFVSTFTFAAVSRPIDAPGTTFQRHLSIARGVLSEDNFLLQEILFNPYTTDQVVKIREELRLLLTIIEQKDSRAMHEYIQKIRDNIRRQK